MLSKGWGDWGDTYPLEWVLRAELQSQNEEIRVSRMGKRTRQGDPFALLLFAKTTTATTLKRDKAARRAILRRK